MKIMKRLLGDIEKRYNVEEAWTEYSLFNHFYTVRLRFKTVDLNLAYEVYEYEIDMVNSNTISYEAFRSHVFSSVDDQIQKYVRNIFYIREESENGN